MTFIGQIRDGRIVLAGNPSLPEGAEVRVEVVEVVPAPRIIQVRSKPVDKLAEMLMQMAGKNSQLPGCPAKNRDQLFADTPGR